MSDGLKRAAESDEELAWAIEAHRSGDLEAAEAGYRLAEAGGDAEAAYQLAGLLEDRKEYDAAREAYQRALELGDSDAILSLAYVLAEHLEREEDAERLLYEAIENGDKRALAYLGDLLVDRGCAQKAEAMYRQAADADPADAESHYRLGGLLKERGEFAAAAQSYERAAALGSREATWSLAYLLAESLHRLTDAEQLLRKAVDEGDDHASMYLGGLLARQGRKEEAEAAYRQAIDMGCTDSDAAYQLGILAEARGALKDAAEAYELAARQGDRDADAELAKLRTRRSPKKDRNGTTRAKMDKDRRRR